MRAGVRSAALAGVLALTAAVAPDAAADGRPPVTNGVFFQPGDPGSIFVRSTFGLLVSRDQGCSFRWICEQAIGYGGQFDPKYAVTAGGTIFATTFTGLRVSRDGGCTWETATADRPARDPGRVADIWVDALDLGPGGEVWIATAESGRPNDVYRSTDAGATFAPRNLRSPTIWWKSVKVAPADGRRVYVTGYQVAGPPLPDGRPQAPRAHFLRSDDAGGRWRPSALDAVRVGPTPIIYAAAVDPANADVVLVTSAGASPPAGDRLYRSADGGATFREVLATSAAVSGVIFHGGAVLVATTAGAFRSADGGATFEPLPAPPQLGCLGAPGGAGGPGSPGGPGAAAGPGSPGSPGDTGGPLFGCGANWRPDDKAVARSTDGGATWTKLFRFEELAGPLACGPGTTVAAKCAPLWPGLQRQFGATPPTGCPAPPPRPAAPPAPPKQPSSGCCDAGDGSRAPLGAVALAAWLALVLRPRPRARRRWGHRAPSAPGVTRA